MYNVIFSMQDLRDILSEEQKINFRKRFNYVRPLPESRDVEDRILYQGDIKSLLDLDSLIDELSLLDAPAVVGVWQKSTGLQQGYVYKNEGTQEEPNYVVARETITDEEGNEQEVEIKHPFNINEYVYYLKDIKEYDQDGNEISSRRPTTQEARNIQVNKFGGMRNRDLSTYE